MPGKAPTQKKGSGWRLICPRDNWRNPIDITPTQKTFCETLAERLNLVCTVDTKNKKVYLDLNVGKADPEVKNKTVKQPDDPGRLSPNFHVNEFACNDGTPVPDWGVKRLAVLCKTVLEPIRSHPLLEGGSLTIISGYRTPSYNARIGGALYSQHKECTAADIFCPELENKYGTSKMVRRVIAAARATKATGIGVNYADFVHVDTRPGPRVEW